MRRMIRIFRSVTIVAAFTFLGFLGSAFTSRSTMTLAQGIDVGGGISGHAVTDVGYELDDTDPTAIDRVTFVLDRIPAARSTIRMQMEAEGRWYACDHSGYAVTCATSTRAGSAQDDEHPTVLGATNLRVIVSG